MRGPGGLTYSLCRILFIKELASPSAPLPTMPLLCPGLEVLGAEGAEYPDSADLQLERRLRRRTVLGPVFILRDGGFPATAVNKEVTVICDSSPPT